MSSVDECMLEGKINELYDSLKELREFLADFPFDKEFMSQVAWYKLEYEVEVSPKSAMI